MSDTHTPRVPGHRSDRQRSQRACQNGRTGSCAVGPKGSSVIPSQTASASLQNGKFTSDPSIVSSGDSYSTDDVAYSGGTHFLPADGISMMNGTSQVIDFPQRMRRVSIADTSIADVQVINPYELNLIGHKPGFTTLTVWTGQGHYEERQVRVSPDGKQQVLLNCIVAELDRGQVENQGTNLSVALQKYGVSLFGIPGAVGTPYSATATDYTVDNQLRSARRSAAPGELPTWRLAHTAAAVAGSDLRIGGAKLERRNPELLPVPRESQHGEDSRRSRACWLIPARRRSSCPAVRFRSSSHRRSTPRSCSRNSAPR